MPKHKDQRIGVFVDVQNLYYSAKQFYHSKVNFAHILNRAVSGRQLIRAIAYVIKADIKEESNFFEALEKIGYDVRAKDLQIFFGGAKKGDWDVGIAMDIMRMASKLDVIVLVSGDGDFKDLLEHVKALGCRAEVIGFKKTVSSRLLNEADEFTNLDKELDRVLIKDKKYAARRPPVQSARPPVQSGKPPVQSRRPAQSGRRPMQGGRKPPQGHRKSYPEQRPDEPSMLQKINMEQPDLVKAEKKEIKMPVAKEKEKKVVKKPVKKPAKKTVKRKK